MGFINGYSALLDVSFVPELFSSFERCSVEQGPSPGTVVSFSWTSIWSHLMCGDLDYG